MHNDLLPASRKLYCSEELMLESERSQKAFDPQNTPSHCKQWNSIILLAKKNPSKGISTLWSSIMGKLTLEQPFELYFALIWCQTVWKLKEICFSNTLFFTTGNSFLQLCVCLWFSQCKARNYAEDSDTWNVFIVLRL